MNITEIQVTSVSQQLSTTLRKLRSAIAMFVERHTKLMEAVDSRYRASAKNLLAYTALRQQDIHGLQLELAQYGLSSLGRTEADVLFALDQVLQRLSGIDLQEIPARPATVNHDSQLNWLQAESLLHTHTYGLFGPRPQDRHIFIMVTAPNEVPSCEWFKQLLQAGMNVLRINTAHGDLATWTRTARLAKETANALQLNLQIMFDFGGQKLRIAAFAPGPRILKLKPKKDRQGSVAKNLQVVLHTVGEPVLQSTRPGFALPADMLGKLAVNDTLKFTDVRGRERSMTVTEVAATYAVVELNRTAYLSDQTLLSWQRQDQVREQFLPQAIPPLEDYAELGVGDRFEIVFDPDQLSSSQRLVVSLAQAKMSFIAGQPISLDDGKVDAVIESVTDKAVQCRVVRAVKKKVKIRGNKGINFSADAIATSILSNDDIAVLPLVLELADLIGISFVRSASDVADVHTILENLNPHIAPGIVIKIETESAVENLPGILLEAMKHYPTGVMIARGDLATEIGYERLAEIQQEILWFCEAAHLPVIWATQVLDNLAHTGIPSRAEVTDAAFAVQAECVMLNKGEYVAAACQTLRDIIHKMEKHQYKKRSLYRALNISMRALTRPTA